MYSIKMRANNNSKHISGAETMCQFCEIESTVKRYLKKAFYHENGDIDFINFKIEKITQPIQTLSSLVIYQKENENIRSLAYKNNIKDIAIEKALKYIKSETIYRGAIILCAESGERLDTSEYRGIRVTNFSFKNQNNSSILNERVQDALAIATCINSHESVKGELCVSDDLNYTTGYFASNLLGYNRIFNIKNKNTRQGGRVIFVDRSIDIEKYIEFLENKPKLVVY